MSASTQPYALLRNILACAKSSSTVTRPVCRHSARPYPAQQVQSKGKRQWSSSAWKAASSPRHHDEQEPKRNDKTEAAESQTPDERFYMPPPPETLQQRIDAARIDAARAAAPRATVKPASEAQEPPVEPEPATAAPERLEETLIETPVQEEISKKEAGVGIEKEAAVGIEKEAGVGIEKEAAVEIEKNAREEAVAAEEALPSKHQEQRWQLSKRVQGRMDELLAKAAVVSHKVNNYTGTDYSGIERLRRDITDQEQQVKAAHAEVTAAKIAYTTSYSQQAASQKEVVGLLERKHSWSAADLERYMSLIRSEHLNEQAVQAAKEHLANAERDLEDARGKLEKKERKQYHEEQIWSDTIRRNSTWVTFGLMGLNIFLLLANLVIFEPWRRRRIVREIKSALDEKTTLTPSLAPAAEAGVDKLIEPAGQMLEKLEEQVVDAVDAAAEQVMMPETVSEVAPDVQAEAIVDSEAVVGETALAAGEVLPQEAIETSDPMTEINGAAERAIEEPVQRPAPENWKERFTLWREIVSNKLALCNAMLKDLFSDRQITVKRIDVTTIALEGAAAGVAVVGLVWALLNSRP